MPLGYSDLYIVIRATNLAESGLASAGKSVSALGDEGVATGTKLSNIGRSMVSAGVMIGAVGALGLDFFAKSVKAAMQYSQQAAYAQTQTQGLGISLQQLEDVGRQVASQIPEPFDQMQQGLYDIFSSLSVNLPQAKVLLTQFAKAGVAGMTDLQTVSKGTMQEMNAFKVPVKDVNKLLDDQFEMVKIGVGSYSDFMNHLGSVVPAAVAAGQTLDTMSGSWAFATRNGLTTASAATSLARALESVNKPAFQAGLQAIGVSSLNSAGKMKQMNEIVTEIAQSPAWQAQVKSAGSVAQAYQNTFGLGTIQARRFFDVAIPNYKQLNSMVGDMVNSKGQMQKAYDIMFKQPTAQIQLLKNNVAILKTEFGNAFLPVVNTVAKAVGRLVLWFEMLSPSTRRIIMYVLLILSAFAALLGILLVVGGAILSFIGALMTMGLALGAAIGVFAGLMAALILIPVALFLIIKYHKDLLIWAKDAWTWIKSHIEDVVAGLALLTAAFPEVMVPLLLLAGAVLLVIKYHKDLIQWGRDAWKAIKEGAAVVFDYIKSHETLFKVLAVVIGALVFPWLTVVAAVALAIKYQKDLIQWAQDAWAIIQTIGATIMDTYIASFTAVYTVVSSLITWFRNTWTAMSNWWKSFWNSIHATVSLIWNMIKTTILTEYNIIATTLTTGLKILGSVFTFAWNQIYNIVKFAWDIIADYISVGIAALETVVKVGWDLVKGIFKTAWDAIALVVKVAWDTFTGYIKTGFDAIKGIFSVAMDLITGKWGKAWDDIKTTVSNVLNDISSTVTNIFGALLNFFKQLATNVYNALYSVGKDLVNGLHDGIIALWHLISDFFSKGAHLLGDFFKGTYELFKQIGEDVVNGLWDGIKAIWHGFTNFFSGLFNGIGKIASGALQSASPSQLFRKIGNTIPQGLILGVKEYQNEVNRTIGAMVSTTGMSTTGSNSMRRLLASGAAGGTVVQVNVPKGAVQVTAPVNGSMDSTAIGSLGDVMDKSLTNFANVLTAKINGTKAP